MNDYKSIYLHFRFKLVVLKFCDSNNEDFKNLFNILIVDITDKNKVSFNSVDNLLGDRHLYLDFENNEKEVNSACDFVSSVLSEDNCNDSEVAQDTGDNRAELKEHLLLKMLLIYRIDD